MLDDRTREYLNARRTAKEYETMTRSLQRHNPACPPTGSPEETKQVSTFLSCAYIWLDKDIKTKVNSKSISKIYG